ncbi:helix-turn-helix domain-containing protein [Flavobacterium facile]|uniref:helix-turn-helix domain-containing protein n=1 Tax=Flavobacterium facile TaxID=2893174 RepID=UPI002E76751D|nr:helix-turn-helix transcriptional regulator [Flavobacterium sp. T-12]
MSVFISLNAQFYCVLNEKEIKLIKSVGQKIRERRNELNLSQEILSFDANIPKNQIGRIERGEINTSIATLYKISEALKIDITYFFI